MTSLLDTWKALCKRAKPHILCHQLALFSNALPTSRRIRHFSTEEMACLLCMSGPDSVAHFLGHCPLTVAARSLFIPTYGGSDNPLLDSSTSSALLLTKSPHPELEICINWGIWMVRSLILRGYTGTSAQKIAKILEYANAGVSTPIRDKKSTPKPTEGRSRTLLAASAPGILYCYTDGSSLGNPGPSGAGALICYGASAWKCFSPLGIGTNNIGELWAIGMALEFLYNLPTPKPTTKLFTDSKWAMEMTSTLQFPKTNAELVWKIRRMWRDLNEITSVSLYWIKGHDGHAGNDIADQLAKRGSQTAATDHTDARTTGCFTLYSTVQPISHMCSH